MKYILPCFYPTTTVFIDDDFVLTQGLIQALELSSKPHKTFSSGQPGVAYLNENNYAQTFVDKLSHIKEDNKIDHALNFKLEDLFDETSNPARYHQPAVLIVDYEMPGMNGIQVCEAITNPYIKKIMLTGVADENIAIDAFNRGLIHQYLRKQDSIEHIHDTLLKAHDAYFQDLLRIPVQIIKEGPVCTPIFEPSFVKFFENLIKVHKIEEYYLVYEQGGFVMIDQNHQLHSLMTLSNELIDTYVHFSLDTDLSRAQVEAIKRRELIPCHFDPLNRPNSSLINLGSRLSQPTTLKGKETTFYSAFGQDLISVNAQKIKFYRESK